MIYIVQNIIPILIATLAGLVFGVMYDRLTFSILPAFGEGDRAAWRGGGAEIQARPPFDPVGPAIGDRQILATPSFHDSSAHPVAPPLHHRMGDGPPPRSRGGSLAS